MLLFKSRVNIVFSIILGPSIKIPQIDGCLLQKSVARVQVIRGPFHDCKEHITKKFVSHGRSRGNDINRFSMVTISILFDSWNRHYRNWRKIKNSGSSRTYDFFRKKLFAIVKRAEGSSFIYWFWIFPLPN